MELILSLAVISVTVIIAVLLHHIIPFWLEREYNDPDKLHEQVDELRKANKILSSRLTSLAYHVSTNNGKAIEEILEQYKK